MLTPILRSRSSGRLPGRANTIFSGGRGVAIERRQRTVRVGTCGICISTLTAGIRAVFYVSMAVVLPPASLFFARFTHPLSLSSSRFWAATAPSFKGNLRLNLSQSKVAESAAGSRTTTTTVCKVVKSRENHVLTKRRQRSICS
jgi:hypothetical protein